ncbi:transporter [Ideonella sp. YS5]|uniref:transporter n=1 Tax=Ideonella sp. YS5 TaxID=3453714 RepID=UPI003EE9A81C
MAISYGAHPFGHLCGFLFRAGEAGQPVDLEQARQWLGTPPAEDDASFVWLHFDLADASATPWMQSHLPLPPEYFEALREGSRSTRLEMADDTLIAVVNDVAYDFSFDPSEIATLWVAAGPRLAVSARVHPLRSIDRLREEAKKGVRFGSPVGLLNRLLRDQGDVLMRIVRQATLDVDAIEDKLLVGRLQRQRMDLGKVRRLLVRLQRLLAPEPAALFRLLRQPPPWAAAPDLDELRQSTEEFSFVIRDMSDLQERIKLLQEEIAAQVSEQTNRSLFTLTMVTVLALPINITTGFFGMNVGGIPLGDDAHGFALVVFLVALFTLLAAWWAFRRRRD